MDFTTVQNRFLKSKLLGNQLLKGKKETGKSTSSIYKAINLENNYCLYEEDKVLILTTDKTNKNKTLEIYNKEKEYCYSLFSLNNNRLEVHTIQELIDYYSNEYKKQRKLNLTYISSRLQLDIINKIINEKREVWKKSIFMRNASNEYLLDEIQWIKASGFSKEQYLKVSRIGRGSRIKKGCLTREFIYDLMKSYSKYLIKSELIDQWDDVLFAIDYSKMIVKKYTHIVLDDCERLTRVEIEFVKSIQSKKDYSVFIFILNSEVSKRKNAWLINSRKTNTINEGIKIKSFLFKNKIESKKNYNYISIDKYEYINLRYKSIINFSMDRASMEKKIFIDEKEIIEEKELLEIPVYNEIAAGEPILISDGIEDTFSLPKYWLGKTKNNFMLKVKGDSMIGKNIDDGDLVVIKKQNTAYNNDIVAVDLDGEATLKTLKLNGESSLLIPANPKYSAITLNDKNVNILGIAIGIIKTKNN